MGREIKFRAWDNVKFKMYYVGESEEVIFELDSNGIVATDITEHHWGFKKLEHLQYMQFTGLHDKNGTPIYEGDVLSAFHGTQFTVVTWNEKYGLYEIVLQLSGLFEQTEELLGNHLEVVEVIGNIYQNPEILEPTS